MHVCGLPQQLQRKGQDLQRWTKCAGAVKATNWYAVRAKNVVDCCAVLLADQQLVRYVARRLQSEPVGGRVGALALIDLNGTIVSDTLQRSNVAGVSSGYRCLLQAPQHAGSATRLRQKGSVDANREGSQDLLPTRR